MQPSETPASPLQPISRGQRWVVLFVVSLGLLLITLDNTILYTALPTLTRELGASGVESLWIINAYPLVMAGLLLGSGTLGDRIGHRRMYLIGLALFGVASAVAAFSPTALVLIGARALLAVGAAAMMPATLALIRTTFRVERERNLAIAIWGSISVIGVGLGPIIGGTLLEFFWWGSIFLINVPVVVVTMIAVVLVTPRDAPDASKRWDFVSSFQAMVGLVGATFAIKEVAHVDPSWPVVVLAVLAAVAGFWFFVRRQRRRAQPMLDFAIFRNNAFSSGVIGACGALFALMGIQLVTTQRFQLVAGFSPLEAGLLLAALAVGTLPTSLLGGAFLHRVGLRILIAGGFAVAAVGAGISAFTLDSFSLFVGGLVVVGMGLGAVMSVASSAIIGNAPVNRAGMAAAVEEVSYEFGGLVAVASLGSLVSFVYSATVELPPEASPEARKSITDALASADGNHAVIEAAGAAYDTGFVVVMVVVTAAMVAAAILTGRLLRAYGPGSKSQLHSE